MSVVVITGSTRGIGRGMAQAFAGAGHRVVISGRNPQEVAQAVAALPGSSGLACDVADPAQVQALWDHACAQFGQVDIWINNAGLAITHKWTRELSPDELRAMTEANLFGGINGTRVALAGMERQGSGWIYTVLGGGSDGRQRDRFGGYGMTKIALRYFTDAMIRETREGPVRLGTILPGILLSGPLLASWLLTTNPPADVNSATWPSISTSGAPFGLLGAYVRLVLSTTPTRRHGGVSSGPLRLR